MIDHRYLDRPYQLLLDHIFRYGLKLRTGKIDADQILLIRLLTSS